MNTHSMTSRNRSRRGSALIAAMIFVLVFSMIVGSALIASTRQTRNTYRARLYNTTLAASAAVVQSMAKQAHFLAQTRPAQFQGNFQNMDSVITNIKPRPIPGYITAKSGNKDLTFFAKRSNRNGEMEVINDPDHDWNGAMIQTWGYRAVAFLNEASDTNATEASNVAKHLGYQGAGFAADVEVNYIPLQQYAIFYEDDLEIHNGPKMDVLGPVHTNSTLWMATGSGVDFHDRVSSSRKIRNYRDFLGVSGSSIAKVNASGTGVYLEGSDHTGAVRIKKNNGSFENMRITESNSALDTNKNQFLDGLDSKWLENAMSRFDGKVQDSSMGTNPIRPPLPFVDMPDGTRKQASAVELIQRADDNDSQSMRAEKIVYKADIIIEGDATAKDAAGNLTNVTIRDRAGNSLYVNKPNSSSTAIVTSGRFYDNRQKKWVDTFDINMKELASRDKAGGNYIGSGNGVVYVSPSGGEMASVRITNGERMPTSAQHTLTIATDRPMYLEGNINNGSGADRATLLLAADAITVTSQRLTESNSGVGKKPIATGKTTTNAIFMMGQVGSKYDNSQLNYFDGLKRRSMSGGAHNVLRYLENWDGKVHEFNGSLICLFESKVATGVFWGSNGAPYYNPPKRNYFWDISLKTKEPPVGMPKLVQVKMSNLRPISLDQAKALANAN